MLWSHLGPATVAFLAIGFFLGTANAEVCSGGDTCCTLRPEKCGVNEGDCDNDAECAGDLVCGQDNCGNRPGFDDTDDCCQIDSTFKTTTTTTTMKPKPNPLTGQDTCSQNTVDKAITLLGLEKAGNRADKRRALIEDLAKKSSYNDVELGNWPLVDMKTLVGFASISEILLSRNIKTLSELSHMNYEDQRKAVIDEIIQSIGGSSQNLQSLGDFALIEEATRLLDTGLPLDRQDRSSRTQRTAIPCNGGDSCCTNSTLCHHGEGDCDFHWQCAGDLKCGVNNCGGGPKFDATDDCCYGENFENKGQEIKSTCMCGMKGPSEDDTKSSKIVGGMSTTEHEFPWQVMITVVSMGFQGGGTLITPSHVLTARHVVGGSEWKPEDVTAHLGSNVQGSLTAFPVRAIYRHPNYQRVGDRSVDGDSYDFAILELETPVPFSLKMLPACLPGADSTDFANEITMVTGWGATEWRADTVKELLKTPFSENPLTIISNNDCNALFGEELEVTEDMICTDPDRNVDSCQGDSGGPMVVVDTKFRTRNWTLVGVVSFGFECASDYPGVYGRVTTVMPWIKETVNLKEKDNEMFDVQCNKLN